MNDDWRSRNKMKVGEGKKAALIILGLMAGCILLLWVVGKLMRG